MGSRDPRVDAYIERSAEFARPILRHLREVVHGACPEVEETIKWGFPHFVHHGILCSMAAFKQHCAFGFWRGSRVVEDADGKSGEAMGQFGRITELSDLPPKRVLTGYVKTVMRRNEEGAKTPSSARRGKPPLPVPEDLEAALAQNAAARATFDGFSPGKRREYVEWVTEAKRPQTRERRVAQAVEWMAEGKPHNWRYA